MNREVGGESTRRQTRTTGQFVRSTPGSRSLERGLALLRAFRIGTSVLTNEELARRTNLPRPTVSRLTRSLVDAGFLVHDLPSRGYRLGAVVLSLSQSFRYAGSDVDEAMPAMQRVADAERVNVGLAVADGVEMIYLQSVRREPSRTHLPARPGSRLPMEHTAAGHAYLAVIPEAARLACLQRLAAQHRDDWPPLHAAIERSLAAYRRQGWCVAEWMPGLPVVATALHGPDGMYRILNISFAATASERPRLVRRYAGVLMTLAADVDRAWRAFPGMADPGGTSWIR